MRRKLLFVLALLVTFSLFAQVDSSKKEPSVNEKIDALSKDLSGKIDGINTAIQKVNDGIEELKRQEAKETDDLKDRSDSTLMILGALALVLFVVCAAGFVVLYKKINALERTPRAASQKASPEPAPSVVKQPAPRDTQPQASGNTSFYPSPSHQSTGYEAPKERPTPHPGTITPFPLPATTPDAVPFDMNTLFTSSEVRGSRTAPDIFLGLNSNVMQKLVEGEKSDLVFEKKPSRYNGDLILVNSQLYPNFYIYNETKALPDSQTFSRTFSIQGSLPGKIKACKPAVVKPSGQDQYVLIEKGTLTIA